MTGFCIRTVALGCVLLAKLLLLIKGDALLYMPLSVVTGRSLVTVGDIMIADTR